MLELKLALCFHEFDFADEEGCVGLLWVGELRMKDAVGLNDWFVDVICVCS